MDYFQSNVILLDQYLSRIKCYRDLNRVRSDVLNILQSTLSLQPNCGIPPLKVQNASLQSMLLYLSGTLPILFKGNQYNIPITIWLPDAYPYIPPAIFVTPTIEMMIKEKHKHVDSIGIVYHPYISTWNQQNCNIVELCKVIVIVFEEDPPVRQKSIQSIQSQLNLNNSNKNEEEKKKKILTQKIQQKLQEFYTITIKEVDCLMGGISNTEEYIEKLNQELKNITSNLVSVEQQIIETSDWLENNNNNSNNEDDDDIDSKTDASDPISRQLFDLVAEDATIEDIIYYLDKALQRDVIDLSVYLKQVRNFSTQQYFKRATIKKIHQIQARR